LAKPIGGIVIRAILFDFYGVINLEGTFNPEILEFIKSNATIYKFGIISATRSDLNAWLLRHNAVGYFDYVQTAAKVQKSKLNPDYFSDALSAMALSPAEAMVVDDNNYYVLIAKDLGINAVHYDPEKDFLSQINLQS
jgi:FMN phosphatase YigB (HAD superfamily)